MIPKGYEPFYLFLGSHTALAQFLVLTCDLKYTFLNEINIDPFIKCTLYLLIVSIVSLSGPPGVLHM